jgi:hypothetical protein
LRAVSYGEAEGFSQTLFQAEEALRGLMAHDDRSAEGMGRTSPSTAEVCDGLKALRQEFAAAPS